jgi:hypothetical protein
VTEWQRSLTMTDVNAARGLWSLLALVVTGVAAVPAGPHLWDPMTAAMGVAAGLGLLVTLVAGARRPDGFPVGPTVEEYTRGP